MNKYPVIKITLFFIIGILAQKILRIQTAILLCAFIISFMALLLTILKIKSAALPSILVLCSFTLLGALWYSNYISVLKQYPFPKQKIQGCVIYGKVKSVELIKEGRVVFNAGADSIRIGSAVLPVQREFIVRVFSESSSELKGIYEKLEIGNCFSAKGTVQKARNRRNPGEFDYNEYLYFNNISGLISVYSAGDMQIKPAMGKSIIDSFNNFFLRARKNIDGTIQKLHSAKDWGLLRGLLLGDYKRIDEESLESFINAGVIHILAVSGQHVALILLIFFFIFNRFNPYIKYSAALIGIIMFLFITGNQISVERAVIMGLFFIAASLLNRDRNIYNILALSAFVILLLNPQELFSPGFQLSYSAVLSIVYIYPVFKKRIDCLPLKSGVIKAFILIGVVSISAQIGTMPFTLSYFHKLSVVAVGANFIIITLSGFIIYLGIITLFAAQIWILPASIFASANMLLSKAAFYFVDLFGKSEVSFFTISQFSVYDACVYYAALFAVIYVINNFRKMRAVIPAVCLIFVNMFIFMSLDNHNLAEPGKLTIIGIDVGQGDATLIRFPSGQSALIDAGNAYKKFSNGDKVILPLMERCNIADIDFAFITHLDADHFYGIFRLIEKNKIKAVYMPFPDSLNKTEQLFIKYLKDENCPVKFFTKEIAAIGGCRFYFLNHRRLYNESQITSNDKSMLLKLVYGNNSFFFTGDAGRKIENKLTGSAGSFLKSDFLKAGHHGSRNSSSEQFIDAVLPRYVLISAGIENKFKHPSSEVVEKLLNIRANIFRTDQQGAVIFSSDGNNISLFDWQKKETQFIFDL